MAERSLTLKAMRAAAAAQVPPRVGIRIAVVLFLLQMLLLLAALFLFPGAARAEMMKGEVSVNTTAGYARLIFTFAEENEADVKLANGVIVIRFKKPVSLSLDRVASSAAAYIGIARRDPDGTAVRLALIRKVTVNSMAAGERLFVDLLPDKWVGMPPGLPQEVVDDLARRAREAEKQARQALQLARRRQMPPVKVRLGTNPTFTRFVFELMDYVPVAVDRDKERMTLTFDAPLRFDLLDVKTALPPMVDTIAAEQKDDSAEVRFSFKGRVEVRTFREDTYFVVDIVPNAAATPNGPAIVTGPGDLPALSLPGLDGNGAAPAAKPPPIAEKPAEAPAAPVADAPKPGPEAESVPRPAAPAASPAVEMPPTGAPPASEPPKAEEAAAPKPAAPPAGAVASKPPAAAARFPPVQGLTEATPEKAAAMDAPVVAELQRQGDALRLVFPFTAPTPAAVFRRFDTLWLVFDTATQIDVAQLLGDPGRLIRSADVSRSPDGQVVRLKLERPRLASIAANGPAWTITLGDMVLDRTAPVTLSRASVGPNRAVAVIAFDQPSRVHRVADPEVGDVLLVATALGPARGMLKTQDFIEFRALASTHGIAIQPLADDVAMELNAERIIIERPSGLALSGVSYRLGPEVPRSGQPVLFDAMQWGADRSAAFNERQSELVQAAAAAPEEKRRAARLDLARFYLGRELFPEARAVLEVAVVDDRRGAEDVSGLMLRAVAKIMMGRNAEALKDLSNPILDRNREAALWRAFAYARQGKWIEAREGFKAAEAVLTTLPIELQRAALKEQLRAAIEVRDLGDATQALNELQTLGVPDDMQAGVSVLSGRLAEGLGRISDALTAYHSAAESSDGPAAAQGRLREIMLGYSLKKLSRADVINELERLTTVWRGDETELGGLQLLAHLYLEENRQRDAFYVMRTAMAAFPNSPITRRIQDEASAAFEALFLGGSADALPPVEALALFYDFRDLTPIGRRGDEMIRRLADRLVSVDLLGQAAELLQHQIDHRLQGAARAQVATRLAMIYLMNRNPDRALQVLRATRAAELSNELRTQRLLLEARALSDAGRHDLALEVIANLSGREPDRLRADILWAGRRWREAAEQIERFYGERWRDFAPLSEVERPDILRAAIGFALAEDQIGMDRMKEKYGPKMAEGPLARSFEVVTTPFAADGPEFRAIAKAVGSIDTLDQFLRDMRARYPETGAAPAAPASEGKSQTADPQRSTSRAQAMRQLAAVP
jgi:tetratricopeptide (TPR) repeat protein